MSHEQIKDLMEQAEIVLKLCCDDLEAGNNVNMDDFDDIVRKLCSTIGNLPKDEAILYQPDLLEMAEALKVLSTVLESYRDNIKSQMHGLNKSSKAQAAYKKRGSNDNTNNNS